MRSSHALATISALALLASSAGVARAITITTYPLPADAAAPVGIAGGPDGTLWLTSPSMCTSVGISSTTLEVVDHVHHVHCPLQVVVGADGFVWTTHPSSNTLECRGTDDYQYNVPTGGGSPYAITFGPDGAVWFTEYGVNKVGRASVWGAGAIDDFPLQPTSGHPSGIAVGNDGKIYIVQSAPKGIVTFDPNTMDFVYSGVATGGVPWRVAAGPNDSVYFTDQGLNRIHRWGPTVKTYWEIPTPGALPYDITLGPDGNLWFTENAAGKIGRMTPEGVITEFALAHGAHPMGISRDSRGNLWFVDNARSELGKIVLHKAGDANADGLVNVSDVFYTINFLFAGGPAPIE